MSELTAALGETAPLLAPPLERTRSKDDVLIVNFAENDQDDPLQWPKAYKRVVVALLTFMAFVVTFTCIGVVPVAGRIVQSLNPDHRPDKSASVLLVTIWELGEAAGPLLIAPLSEIYGRYRVVNIANIGFILATVLAALSQSTHLFIFARALTGFAVMSNVLNPAIVGDIFISEERGSAMSLIMLAPLTGGAIGPAIAGALAEGIGWRAIIWGSVILASVCELLFLTCFRETYKVVILRDRAVSLREETGNIKYRTAFEINDADASPSRKFWTSITRPFIVFFGSFVLQAISIFGAETFTFFYIMSTSLPDILQDVYNLSPAQTGLFFILFSIGSIMSNTVCNIALDRIYIYLKTHSKDGQGQPEFRLPLVIIGSVALPLIVIAYGWIAELHAPLWVLGLCLGVMGAMLLLAFLPVLAYVVDATGVYSASAMTAVIVTRCLFGTFLPLSTGPLVKRHGYGWAFTIICFVALGLAPIPMVLFRYGSKWRQGSAYTRGG